MDVTTSTWITAGVELDSGGKSLTIDSSGQLAPISKALSWIPPSSWIGVLCESTDGLNTFTSSWLLQLLFFYDFLNSCQTRHVLITNLLIQINTIWSVKTNEQNSISDPEALDCKHQSQNARSLKALAISSDKFSIPSKQHQVIEVKNTNNQHG